MTMSKMPRGQHMAIVMANAKMVNKAVQPYGLVMISVECDCGMITNVVSDVIHLGTKLVIAVGLTSSCCRSCGQSGYYVKECKGTEEERAVYRDILR